ncbi:MULTISPECIES: permease [unclassified Streptomyces]|uniref:permease n=1 Tax=unclassified Streptomyces TaxID=2593676 RepID=UPI0022551FC4|nr:MULTISPECIES: permease [unclassified Streptomyces]MCX4878925.1 permease [Streptomyces sp. NBC_00847]MCX5418880.1 permease [Streptomyces sp. NBC_00078]
MQKTDELVDVAPPSVIVAPDAHPRRHLTRWPPSVGIATAAGLVAVLVLTGGGWLRQPAVAAWRTVCLAITVQALPFLLLGTALSGAINAFVPADLFTRILPRRPALAVPVAGLAGVVLPGCECASVPVANSLIRRGVNPAAAFAFLLSAPAINPIVLTATAVAFPGNPAMVAARLVASLLTAAAMGWLWLWLGREEWLRPAVRHTGHRPGHSRWKEFRLGFRHDFLHAGGFLVLGAMAAATFNVAVPSSVLDTFSGSPWLSVLFLAGLAVLLAVCSEADAFVAASLTGFSPTARLAFMVVGPMVDLKLIALQTGTFGRAFALRFSTATTAVAVVASGVIGGALL